MAPLALRAAAPQSATLKCAFAKSSLLSPPVCLLRLPLPLLCVEACLHPKPCICTTPCGPQLLTRLLVPKRRLNNCIGYKNYRSFFLLILYITLGCTYSAPWFWWAMRATGRRGALLPYDR
jgi:hypothetical protein